MTDSVVVSPFGHDCHIPLDFFYTVISIHQICFNGGVPRKLRCVGGGTAQRLTATSKEEEQCLIQYSTP